MHAATPHLNAFLNSKFTPSCTTAQEARRLLANEETIVHRLEACIERAQVLLAVANDRADAYRDMLAAPVLRVPPEIISEIFRYCAPDERIPFPPDPQTTPVVLTHICSTWRKIAHDTSELWPHVECDNGDVIAVNAFEAVVGSLRNTPSGIDVDFRRNSHVNPDSRLWSTIMRARELYLKVRNITDLYTILGPASGSLTSLKELGLRVGSVDEDEEINPDLLQPLDIFMNSPHLRSVTVYRPTLFSLQNIRLPWSQITELAFHNAKMSLQDYLDLLRQCPMLEDAAICPELIGPGETDALSSPVTLPRLHTLLINFLDIPPHRENVISPLFESFTLPALKKLLIGDATTKYVWPADAFEVFMIRSSLELYTLAINIPLRLRDFVAILERSPTLTTLCVPFTKAIFKALYSTRRALLVPQLEHLIVSYIPPVEPVPLWELAQFAKSRWWPDSEADARHRVKRLRAIEIHEPREHAAMSMEAALKPYSSRGLKVSTLFVDAFTDE